MSNDLLDFLTDGLHGRQRDAVTRAFYEYASGDAQSAPVGMAVLLTACARRVALAPQELREANADFKTLLHEAKQHENRVIERMDRSNASVVASFRDETVRANETLRETVIQADRTKYQAEQMAKEMKPVVATVTRLARDLPALGDELKLNHETAKKIADGTENIKTSQRDIYDLVKHLTKEARINWMTIGFLAGAVFAGLAQEFPSWAQFILLALGVGLLQWLSRRSWKLVKLQAEKLLSFSES